MNELNEVINSAENILILPHINADGDAVGSAFALAAFARKLGKNADVVFEEQPEEVYSIITSEHFVYPCELREYDLKISVDASNRERLGKRAELFWGNTLNIDHHKTNTKFAGINYVGEAAAAGEIIYELIENCSRDYFDKYIGECLYVAVSTDTGSFRYSNTTPKTLRIAAELLELGIDAARINTVLYATNSFGKLQFQAEVISGVRLGLGGRTASYILTKERFDALPLSMDDVSGVSNLLLSIEGVEVGIFIHEREQGEFKASLRSHGNVDVAAISNLFEGGGHTRAAGFSFTGDPENNLNELLKIINKGLQNGN